jgi:hypothetical protein
MQKWNRYQRIFGEDHAADFERRVNDAVANAVREMDKLVEDETKIQYVTHVFAKTLDQLQSWLQHPKMIN